MADNQSAAPQSFGTAYPFEFKLENQFQYDNLSVLYIVNHVDASASAQKVKLVITNVDGMNYTLRGLGSGYSNPGPSQFNLAFATRPGTFRDEVRTGFAGLLTTALQAAIHAAGATNSVHVSGPMYRSQDNASVWYASFQNDFAIDCHDDTPGQIELLLEGVSAAAGVGSRSTRFELSVANLFLNDTGNPITFTRLTTVDIINHRGQTYAPIHFNVLGENTVLNEANQENHLTVYFETTGRVPIQFGEGTEVVFSFPYSHDPPVANDPKMVFGTESQVQAFSLAKPEDNAFQPSSADEGNNMWGVTAAFPQLRQQLNPEYTDLQNSVGHLTELAMDAAKYFGQHVQSGAAQFVSAHLAPALAATAQIAQQCATLYGGGSYEGNFLGGDGPVYHTANALSNPYFHVSYSDFCLDIDQPFTPELWVSQYNKAAQHFAVFTEGEDPKGAAVLTLSVPGSDCTYNPDNPWTDSDFTQFVTENFNSLCQALVSIQAPDGSGPCATYLQYIGSTDHRRFVVPCQTLFQFFQIMRQRKLALSQVNPALDTNNPYAVFLIDPNVPFSEANWTSCYNAARTILPDPSILTQSAPAITTNFNPANPWSDTAFTAWLKINYNEVLSDIPTPGFYGNWVSPINENYFLPSQCLYDYFWIRYQYSGVWNQFEQVQHYISEYQKLSSYAFNFTLPAISGANGDVSLGVTVRNLPGYWDTNLQVPINKVPSTSNTPFNHHVSGNMSVGGAPISDKAFLSLPYPPNANLHNGILIGDESNVGNNAGALCIAIPEDATVWALAVMRQGQVKGGFNDSFSWYTSSDLHAKTDIEPLPTGTLSDVLRLKPKRYQFKDDAPSSQKSIGFIAQEVKAIFPDAVEEKDGQYFIRYQDFSVLAIAAIQEQQKAIDDLNERLTRLEQKLGIDDSDND